MGIVGNFKVSGKIRIGYSILRSSFIAYNEVTDLLNIRVQHKVYLNVRNDHSAMTIVRGGDWIGIGNPKPESKLTVAFPFTTKDAKDKSTIQEPIFLFEEKCNQSSVKETEKFIKIHSYLSKVPSAKEIQTIGLN